MSGAVTEPKTSPWKVTAQNIEERIKFKHNNSRIALALRNAKIHRPGLYLPANKTSNCSNSLESTAQANMTLSNPKSNKTKSSKRADRVNCRKTGDLKNRSGALSSDASDTIVSKLDSMKLRCSCQTAERKKSGNPLEEAGGNLARTVKLKTVNVNPWTNDGVKKARIIEPRAIMANRTPSDDGTSQHTSQKLLKPGRIDCSHGGIPQGCHMGEKCLSGILLGTSKLPANPCSFPLIKKDMIKPNYDPVFERCPRLSTMRLKVCDLCEVCRKAFQNVRSRVHGPDMQSENLTRLKDQLKLKERDLLKMECNFDKPQHKGSDETCSNELPQDETTKCRIREKITLPKLYLTHHSTAIAGHQKARKTRIKMIASENCSNATKQRCNKLAKVEWLDKTSSPRDKFAKNSAKINKVQGSFSPLFPRTGHLRMLSTPLRGFTPVCLPESPVMWRENESEVQDIVQEKEMTEEH